MTKFVDDVRKSSREVASEPHSWRRDKLSEVVRRFAEKLRLARSSFSHLSVRQSNKNHYRAE